MDQNTILLAAWLLFIGMILSACFSRFMHIKATHNLRKENQNLKDQFGELRDKNVEMHFELKYIFHTIEAQFGRKLSENRDQRMAELRDLLPKLRPEVTIN